MRKRKATWKSDTALGLLGIVCAALSVQFAITKISDTKATPSIAGMEHLRIFAMPANGNKLPGRPSEQATAGPDIGIDPIVTGSIRPATGEPSTNGRSSAGRPAISSPAQAALLNTYTVQGVFDGKALLQGPSGYLLVSSGDTIAGIGRVQSIQNRDGNWIVQTPLGALQSRR